MTDDDRNRPTSESPALDRIAAAIEAEADALRRAAAPLDWSDVRLSAIEARLAFGTWVLELIESER